MTPEEFRALPEARAMFALWIDPNDKRCGWVMGDYGVEWTIGKARMNGAGHWDPEAPWILVRQHRYAGLPGFVEPVETEKETG